MRLCDDLRHRGVIRPAPIVSRGVQLPDAAGIVRIINVRRIGRIHEHEVSAGLRQGQAPGVGLLDIRPGRSQVKAGPPPASILADIQSRAAAAHRVYHQVPLAGIPLEKLPEWQSGLPYR